jgi:Protein of unknown function (DUF3108)
MGANPKRIQNPACANANGRISANCRRIALGWAVALGIAAACAQATPAMALQDGERLTYSVRWGFIPAVGTIVIAAEKIGTGDDAVLRVTTTTSTWGLARGIFAFDGRGESVYNAKTGLLLSSGEWSAYRNKVVKNSTTFNYGKSTALYSDDMHPEKSRTLPMPEGNPSDLIIALIQTRNWNLEPGQQRDTLVIFEDQFYPLTVHAEDYETLFTMSGIFKALPLVPRMEKTPPVGMFKRGSTVEVWIEMNDNRRLPVRFDVGFAFGTGTATLTDYTPPK